MMPLVVNDGGDASRKASPSKKGSKSTVHEDESRDGSRSDSENPTAEKESPTKDIGNRLRGLFGF